MKVIITGATGMVGEGVLFECLENSSVKQVLMINRRPYDKTHPKLKELIVTDFSNLKQFSEQLKGYDACFYCAGISSVGVAEDAFTKATYGIVIPFAETLSSISPNMVFTYVSGAGTDSSEKGKVMWARIKGKTENALTRLPFKKVYNFRPAIMKAFKGQVNVKTIYKILAPLIALFYPRKTLSLKQVGRAMINSVLIGYPKSILEVKDIGHLAKQ
ncbi:MAG: NAD-dependent epimerase/dehydratase family protein [Bacteroidota bacterium]